jgi:hypothetical protein
MAASKKTLRAPVRGAIRAPGSRGKGAEGRELDPGIYTGMIAESPEQTLGAVTVAKADSWSWAKEGLTPFGSLDAIAFSELVRDLEGLR